MKSLSRRALAAICVVTFAAAGCATDRVTGPEAANAAAGDEPGGAAAQGGIEKVTICHIPPGNPENQHTITIGAPAVPAHITLHGDYTGECQIQK